MEHQDRMKSSWREYLCSQSRGEFGATANWPAIGGEVESSNAQLDEEAHLYRNFWNDSEPARVKNWTSRSFAMDARLRLDSLKSGCNSPQPWGDSDNSLYYYDSEKDLWNGGDVEEEQSALDMVEILDMEESTGDEESWLYEPPNRPSFGERESALRWCRHVLDNPSPEMEAARRGLMNKLDPRSRYYFCRHAAVSTHSPSVSLGFAQDETSVHTSLNDSDSLDHAKVTHPDDFITTSYRLQDITDVHIMARIQEDSLRQDYISMPAAALLRRNPDVFSSFLNAEADYAGDFSSRNKNTAPDSACKPGLTATGSSSCKLPTPAAKQGGQSPKLTKLHQQVTQFKLLRLAQNKASPGRMRSPLQTSLRSLQAVRNSRSLEADVSQPAGQSNHHPPVVPPSTTASSRAAYLNSSDVAGLMRESTDRITAVKRLQRSQSLSPSRIAHPSKGCLSVRGRIFASPDRVSTAAWGRHASSIQR
ncbi:SLAIN motif-containing protein-like isoform X1 [Gambusia affinis]|uniref:SLAIN motif-containing protein-like isoform X1 n=2 Tax=Gambusia affinis TaxID=33528 RepID=UPI001CDD105C|nr:SLAIN motif-containing protein-like isoform X1 [Gambusia affinis]XP_043996611.1 SLAIN motif-containing protein-like isoform X1 [Gambusia affinis]